jgi:hypothetical protein
VSCVNVYLVVASVLYNIQYIFHFTGYVYKIKNRKLEDKEICVSRKIRRYEFLSVLHHKTTSFEVRWCQLQRKQLHCQHKTSHLVLRGSYDCVSNCQSC